MKDVATALQSAYYTLLNGNLSYGGDNVPVYDTVPSSPSYPYVQFGDRTSNDDSTKTSFGSDDTVLLSIVDRFESGVQGSRARINSVANQVFGIIRVRPIPFSLADFNVITATVENDLFLRELDATHLYLRREIRFSHLIEEKP